MWFSPPWDEVVYWSLDLETGGLDAKRDPVIAVGMLPVRAGVIRLGESYESLVRPAEREAIRPDSMRAHQLVPSDVRDAPPLDGVVAEIDRRLREGALLVHNASVDVSFLKRVYRGLGLRWPSPPIVDTVNLLLRAARRSRFLDPGAPAVDPEVNRGAARRALGLPAYDAHRALIDAVATAELFLVLRRRLDARRLRDLT